MHERDCRRLSLVRLEDAQVLLNARRFAAAYYVGGYSVELALKAVIATRFRLNDIPDPNFVRQIYTHQPDTLIGLAGLRDSLLKRIQESRQFAGHWGVVKEWDPESRYEVIDQVAAEVLIRAIEDKKVGVLTWIKSFWTKDESKQESS